MSFGKLYSYPGNTRTIAAEAVAKANGLELEVVPTMPIQGVSAEFKSKFPLAKIPSFEGADGYKLTETFAITVYLASQNEKTSLLGKTKSDYASVLQWMSFASTDLWSSLAQWFVPILGYIPYNKKNVDDAEKKTNDYAAYLENYLKTRTFLVGQRITLADLYLACHIAPGFKYFFDAAWRQEHPALTRWYATVVNQEMYKAVAGESVLAQEVTKYTPPKKEKKEEKPKKEAAPPKKKEEKPAKKEEEEEDTPKEVKAKHPLEALGAPKSIPLDEWKRQYSNNDTPVALQWFWEHYDSNDFSLWKIDYKYNSELTQVFMSSNLIGGLFARLEASRKYLFGSVGVYGENNNSVITGAFLVRGKDFKPAFEVAPDWESYDFSPIDPSNAEQKKFLEEAWAWEGTYEGKAYADGKVFK
ncbi:elongation factor EF-1 gamma subunit [Saitoella coloradoensis]